MTDITSKEELVWYQTASNKLTEPNIDPKYFQLLTVIRQRLELEKVPIVDFIFCNITNTTNIVGPITFFLGLEDLFRQCTFEKKHIPSPHMDYKQRLELITMIHRGGSYRVN